MFAYRILYYWIWYGINICNYLSKIRNTFYNTTWSNTSIYDNLMWCKILTKLIMAKHPGESWALCTVPRIHFMYPCSIPIKAVAMNTPQSRSMKRAKNCSGANGSLAFFSSLYGLHVPVNQNLRSRSKSP